MYSNLICMIVMFSAQKSKSNENEIQQRTTCKMIATSPIIKMRSLENF